MKPRPGSKSASIRTLTLRGVPPREIAEQVEVSLQFVHAAVSQMRRRGHLPRQIRIIGTNRTADLPVGSVMHAVTAVQTALVAVQDAVEALDAAWGRMLVHTDGLMPLRQATDSAADDAPSPADPAPAASVARRAPGQDSKPPAPPRRASVLATGQSRLGAPPPVPATAAEIVAWASDHRCSYRDLSDLVRVNAVRLQVGQPPFAIVDVPPGPAA